MNNTGKVMIGLLSMFAAGALVGVLFAPEKGERTRRKIGKKSKDMLDSINDKLEDSKDKLDDIRGQLKSNIGKTTDKIEQLVQKN